MDSLQVAWEIMDISKPGEWAWGKHKTVQFLVDNVSFGSFSATSTVFEARGIDIFDDTFAFGDPAHTSFLTNSEQNMWIGGTYPGNIREFDPYDSLSVDVHDMDGITEGNVLLWWRHDNGGDDPMSAWASITMDLGQRDATSYSDEGTYRAIIEGNDTDPLTYNQWVVGTTVEYYLAATDDLANVTTFPAAASDPAEPGYFEFSVLPFDNTDDLQNFQKYLIVDDFGRSFLDFENSTDWSPSGGSGQGTFDSPVYDSSEDMVELAMDALGLQYDKYDVMGAGSNIQNEPVGSPNTTSGGYMTTVGDPYYDALIWLQGSFDAYSLFDTTRIELGNYLENGGKLLICGDNLFYYLGTGGSDADSITAFAVDYLGVSFTDPNDDRTDERILNVEGVAGSSQEGMKYGLYGECPIVRNFDRIYLSAPPAATTNEIVMTYADGGAGDNGRAAVIKCTKNTLPGKTGVSVSCGFDISAFLTMDNRACFLRNTFVNDFGLEVFEAAACTNSGTDAPVVTSFGFDLAQSSPNPFVESTDIKFSVPTKEHVTIEVYNILGQKVRTLVNETLDPNAYTRTWDGRADSNEKVSSGIYFYKMVAGDFSATRKLVVLN
ncbi:MAG: T9SS type A sorting domain-containing protein [Gemmatimonadota bacterium]|nr:T9SS type A sorting domain-containing protein [Gemmatimonadota bacterium]